MSTYQQYLEKRRASQRRAVEAGHNTCRRCWEQFPTEYDTTGGLYPRPFPHCRACRAAEAADVETGACGGLEL